MLVADVMVRPVVVVQEDVTLEAAAWLMLERHIGCLPVVDQAGNLCGIITPSDFLTRDCGCPTSFRAPSLLGHWIRHQQDRGARPDVRRRLVREAMTAHVDTVTEDDSLDRVVRLMLERRVGRIPVVREGVPVGLVSRHDLLRVLWRDQLEREFASRPPRPCRDGEPDADAGPSEQRVEALARSP